MSSGSRPQTRPGRLCLARVQARVHSSLLAGLLAHQHAVRAEDMLTADEDEYSDDQDVGFTRQRVRDQHTFLAHEVDLSDNDSSARGTSLYHRAQSYKSSEHVRLVLQQPAQREGRA